MKEEEDSAAPQLLFAIRRMEDVANARPEREEREEGK